MNNSTNRQLNLISLHFIGSEIERDYQERVAKENVQRFRLAIVSGVLFYALFIFVDPIIFKVAYESIFIVRIWFVFPVLLLVILTTYTNIYRSFAQVISLIAVASSGIGLVLNAYFGGADPEISRLYVAIIVLFFYLYSLLNISYLVAGVTGTLLVLSYMWVSWFINQIPWPIFLHMSSMLIGGNIFGIMVSYMIERQSKTEYLLRKELSETVIKDTLTGLYNRHYFEEFCKGDIQRFIEHSMGLVSIERRHSYIKAAQYGLFMIDIDHFKKVNDSFGHESGDEVLKQFAKLLKDNVRGTDDVLRFGGEEFLLVIKLTTEEYLVQFMEKLGRLIENNDFVIEGGRVIGCTASIGLVTTPTNQVDDVQELIRIADRALYHSKDFGRNRGSIARQTDGQTTYQVIHW